MIPSHFLSRTIRKIWEEQYKAIGTIEPETPPAKKKKTTPSDFLASQVGSAKKDKRDELQKYLDSPVEAGTTEQMKTDGALGWWKVTFDKHATVHVSAETKVKL